MTCRTRSQTALSAAAAKPISPTLPISHMSQVPNNEESGASVNTSSSVATNDEDTRGWPHGRQMMNHIHIWHTHAFERTATGGTRGERTRGSDNGSEDDGDDMFDNTSMGRRLMECVLQIAIVIAIFGMGTIIGMSRSASDGGPGGVEIEQIEQV